MPQTSSESFESRAVSFSREERTALATRSLSAVNRLSGDARREALHEHFDRFTPVIFAARPRS